MDVVKYFLTLPFDIGSYTFNVLGYNVSIVGIVLWVAFIGWLWNMFYKLFD